MTEPPSTSASPRLPKALRVSLVAAVVVLLIAIPVAPTVQSGGGTVPVVIGDSDLEGMAALLEFPEGTRLELADGPSVTLVVDELPRGLSLLTAAGTVLSGLFVAAAAWLLIRILLDIRAGRPFSGANPRRLGALAVVVLAGGLFPQLADNVSAALVLDHLGITGSAVPEGYTALGYAIVNINFATILLVVAIAILAEAFQHGQRLSADVDGLV